MFLNVSASMTNGSSISNSQFFFDTGADVTVLSEFSALQLGFDTVLRDAGFTVAVVGSGGVKLEVPGFFVDHFTLPALGGSITLDHVPVVVLNVTNPADPGNVVPGIVGTNLLSGRNIVIDPDPSIGGGNLGPQLYISDPVTSAANWTAGGASVSWESGGSWSIAAVPGVLNVTNVRHVAGGNQQAVVSANATSWEVNVSGDSASGQMTVLVQNGVTLTTFAGFNVEHFGNVILAGGSLDVQYVDIRDGGRFSGNGSIATGSGSIAGQVENVSGFVAPGNGVGILNIEGRYSNGPGGVLEIEIAGLTAGTQYDQLLVDGPATLAGTLKVLLPGVSPFTPALGAAFTILTASDGIGGEFDSLALPSLPAGRAWFVGYGSTALSLKVTIPGDFDGDFDVDAADLAAWKAGFGSRYTAADFLVWQRNLGGSFSPISGVPEPGAGVLAAFGACVAGVARRRRQI